MSATFFNFVRIKIESIKKLKMGTENKNEGNAKKGGLFGKIGSLIFEVETKIENSQPSKFAYSDVSVGTNPMAMVPNANGVFDQKFYDNFLKVIEENNIEGVDYFEFSRAKKANDNLPGLTEATKFQLAYNTLKANFPNLTKERLLETANFYIGKLDNEAAHFKQEMDNELSNKVASKLDAAKLKQDEIAKKQEQIAQLQAEIGQAQAEIASLNSEAQQNQSKIEATAKNFQVSLDVLKAQIEQDKANINNFIQ